MFICYNLTARLEKRIRVVQSSNSSIILELRLQELLFNLHLWVLFHHREVSVRHFSPRLGVNSLILLRVSIVLLAACRFFSLCAYKQMILGALSKCAVFQCVRVCVFVLGTHHLAASLSNYAQSKETETVYSFVVIDPST